MKSQSQQRSQDSGQRSVRQQAESQAQDMGNAAAQEGMDAMGIGTTPTLDALGLDGLQVTEDSVSYEGAGIGFDESIDVTLGAIGPLTVGLSGALAASLDYGFRGDIQGGWFGGRYAEITGHAKLDLDTSVMANVALNLLVAEGGLRGGLSLKGGLEGETKGCLSFDDDGVHLDSLSLSVSGEAVLGAAAELYLETLLTDEQTWELGALPLGIASGFSLDLSWDDSGFSGIDGSIGTGFEMSPELEALIDDLKSKVGA